LNNLVPDGRAGAPRPVRWEFSFRPWKLVARSAALAILVLIFCGGVRAQGRPYFVAYNHHMEEPGALEISVNPLFASQDGGNDFVANWVEFEYGAKAWWTTEFYLDSQSTRNESTLFTGFRWENRFRLLWQEHWINPVFYIEYVDINDADKIMKDVVGHDTQADHATPNDLARRERKREIELKLILSSNFKGWNISENIVAEKNLSNEPWEFGYALGVSRPLALAARPDPCTFCPENFIAGIEMYGGLGDRYSFGLKDTSHYLAPLLAWNLPRETTVRISPTFGLNENSHRFLLRFGISHEFGGFGRRVAQLFRGGKP
jgi:hypothetical protein